MHRERLESRISIVFILCLVLLFLSCRVITWPKKVPDSSPTPTSAQKAETTPTNTPFPAKFEPTPTERVNPTPTQTNDIIEPSPTAEKDDDMPAAIGPFEPLASTGQVTLSNITQLLTGPNGNLWVIGENNVASYDGDNWLSHGDIEGLSLGFDGVGRLWVVDQKGNWISAYDGDAWVQYGPEDGWLPAGQMYREGMYASVSEGVVTDAEGDTWLVTVNDVRVLRGSEWSFYTAEEVGFTPSELMAQEEFGFLLSDIAIDSTGDVWVTDCAWMGPGPQGQGARWYDGESWMGQDSPVVSSGCIRDIEIGDDGRIWAGVDDEVWRYTLGEGWEEFPHPVQFPIEGVRWGWIVDLLLDGTDAVWMTMVPCGGASCDLGMSITFWIYEDEWLVIGQDGIPDVAVGGNNLSWGCFADGLYTNAAGEFIPVAVDLPSVCQVQADKTGRVWLGLEGTNTLWYFDAP